MRKRAKGERNAYIDCDAEGCGARLEGRRIDDIEARLRDEGWVFPRRRSGAKRVQRSFCPDHRAEADPHERARASLASLGKRGTDWSRCPRCKQRVLLTKAGKLCAHVAEPTAGMARLVMGRLPAGLTKCEGA